MMQRQFEQLVRLVDDLLDVSRIARGKIELRPEATTLGAVLERAVEASRPLIEARNHTLSFDLPEYPLALYVDPVRLAQVITNLLTNAAKYTDEGGRIVVAAQARDDELLLSVRDTGIGIPRRMLPHVFEMFMQIEPGGTRVHGGLGIGLTLVKSMVQMHGGQVEVHSEGPGMGSEFLIRLPLHQPPQRQQETPHLPEEFDGRKSILVVDDNIDSANTLAALLKSKRHDVQVAYDGPAALHTAERVHPEVVILDLGMPGMDGCQVAEQLRARKGGDEVLLLALTGWGGVEDRQRTRAAGFDYHFVKPANLLDIGRAIARGRRDLPLEATA
jgi:CheY-like chemotaxis protein